MKKLYVILVVTALSGILSAQNNNITWQKNYGGAANDEGMSVKTTLDSGYVVAGSTYSNNNDVHGNHDQYVTYPDGWVVKVNKKGDTLWTRALGGNLSEKFNSVKVLADSTYIVAGYAYSQSGDVLGIHGASQDMWVVKLSKNGNIVWQKCLGGTNSESANTVEPTLDKGFIIGGLTNSNDGDITSGYHDVGGVFATDGWVVKLDSMGVIQWQKCLGGNGDDEIRSIKPLADGGFIVAGSTRSTDGDVTGKHGAAGIADGWVLKLNSLGVIQWQKCIGGLGNDEVKSVSLTQDGNFMLACTTNSSDGDVSSAYGGNDGWLVKLNSNTRSIMYQTTVGGSDDDVLTDMQFNADGSYYVSGYTKSGESGMGRNHGNYDGWLIKFDTDNSLTWQKYLGGFGNDFINGIALNKDRSCVVAGTTSSIDGDITNNYGASDVWVVRLPLCTGPKILSQPVVSTTACSGTKVAISVATSGWYLHYVWKNGAKVVGKDSSSLVFDNISTSDAGTYNVEISGPCGAPVVSSFAAIKVNLSPSPVVRTSGDTLIVDKKYLSYEWSFNDSIPISSGKRAIASQKGNYKIIVTDSIGCRGTYKIAIGVTEPVTDTKSSDGVDVFPNPSHGAFTVNFGKVLTTGTADIYSENGLLITSFPFSGYSLDLDMSNLSNGTYVLKIVKSDGTVIKRFVKY